MSPLPELLRMLQCSSTCMQVYEIGVAGYVGSTPGQEEESLISDLSYSSLVGTAY